MPATATHAFFAKDLYDSLDSKNKLLLKNNIKSLMMFAQSTDSLMFYNITNLKKGKKIRSYQKLTHSTKTNEFFDTLITYIKEKKYYNNPQVLTFLYGLISHFSLDTNIHPYIFYKTGYYDKSIKESEKYNCLHNYIETYFDNVLIKQKLNINPNNFDISNFCFDLKEFSKELNDTIDYTFKNTYNINNMSKIYYTSLKQMKLFLYLFRKDKYGIKKMGYKIIDKITPKNAFIFETLSYNQKNNKYEKYLNNDNLVWNYPVDKNIVSRKSFEQLYNHSLIETTSIINEINDYFYKDKTININNLFHNKSYVTGIDCNKNLKQNFFEF